MLTWNARMCLPGADLVPVSPFKCLVTFGGSCRMAACFLHCLQCSCHGSGVMRDVHYLLLLSNLIGTAFPTLCCSVA